MTSSEQKVLYLPSEVVELMPTTKVVFFNELLCKQKTN